MSFLPETQLSLSQGPKCLPTLASVCEVHPLYIPCLSNSLLQHFSFFYFFVCLGILDPIWNYFIFRVLVCLPHEDFPSPMSLPRTYPFLWGQEHLADSSINICSINHGVPNPGGEWCKSEPFGEKAIAFAIIAVPLITSRIQVWC